MKQSNAKANVCVFRGAAALITAALLTAALLFTGCSNAASGSDSGGGGTPPTPKHEVTFGVDGANGTLKAKADGVAETEASPITVEQGKTVTFTAAPAAGYRVKGWTLDGVAVNGNNNSYSFSVTKAVNVKVSFEDDSTPLPTHSVTFGVDGGHGTLKAKADGVAETETSPITVQQGKTVTFTATPEPGYKVKEWKVGGAVVTGSTSNTYTHPVTEAVAVTVSFEVGSAVLTLSPGHSTIKVTAVTSDGSAITVEGCTETTLASSYTETTLTATGTTVVLKGKIIGLACEKNQLTAINVQDCTALQGLNCDENQLKALNVQGLSALKELKCSKNQLTDLKVQGLSALQWLNCDKNKLTDLDVHGLSNLQKLNCEANQLTALNVQGLSALEWLNCDENRLKALNVQGLSALQTLSCDKNKLTDLDVHGLSNLQKLKCSTNELTSLNVQGLSKLKELSCNENKLIDLNVQGLSALQTLYCNANGLTSLGIQGLSNLKELSCTFNQLNAEAFIKLFNDLPKRTESDGATCTLYFEGVYHGESDGNHRNFTSPEELSNAFQNAKNVKKWKMYKYIIENGKPKPVEIN